MQQPERVAAFVPESAKHAPLTVRRSVGETPVVKFRVQADIGLDDIPAPVVSLLELEGGSADGRGVVTEVLPATEDHLYRVLAVSTLGWGIGKTLEGRLN